jgi:hypothetical protein
MSSGAKLAITCQARSLAKCGNAPEENDDAHWCPRRSERPTFRCAVADGATEASFSGQWAKMLVEAYGRGRFSTHAPLRSIARLQRVWHAQVTSMPLPWYAEEKLKMGAFSSLLGLSIHAATDGLRAPSWTAVSVGDSCLFQIRADRLLRSFPIARSDAFDNRPFLLASIAERNVGLSAHMERAFGDWDAGDAFLLMTDALAAWFLRAAEKEATPWIDLARAAQSEECFAGFVSRLREDRLLRNDDVTFLCVMMGE